MSEKACLSSRRRLDFLATRLDADPIVNRVSKAPLTAEVVFGGLEGDVAEQKLNLVQFASGFATQAGASPS